MRRTEGRLNGTAQRSVVDTSSRQMPPRCSTEQLERVPRGSLNQQHTETGDPEAATGEPFQWILRILGRSSVHTCPVLGCESRWGGQDANESRLVEASRGEARQREGGRRGEEGKGGGRERGGGEEGRGRGRGEESDEEKR